MEGMVAIVPAAGKGTRMQHITGGSPKELLSLGSKPVLLRVMEEARESDPDLIVIVTSREKQVVNDAVQNWAKTIFADIPVQLAFQDDLNGLAGAVHAAEVEDDVIVLVGDSVFAGGSPVQRMSNLIYRGMDACVAVRQVTDAEIGLYGIVEVNEVNGSVTRILEKPPLGLTSSRWAVSGRFGLNRSVVAYLSHFMSEWSVNREVTLTDVLSSAIKAKMDIRAVPVQQGQERLDCGDPDGYDRARRMLWD